MPHPRVRFEVIRFASTPASTAGALYRVHGPDFFKREFLCFTLEDEYREVKVPGSTRIPAGEYILKLREFGGHHRRYSLRFPDFHRGMIELVTDDRPDWSDVLLHIGNTEDDTAGCLLVGDRCDRRSYKFRILQSTVAYRRVYQEIIREMAGNGHPIRMNIVDFDTC